MNNPLQINENDIRRSARIIITHAEIEGEIKRIANEIEGSIGNQSPVVLSILNGSICFTGYLLTELDFALRYDVFSMSRYGQGTTGGELQHLSYPRMSLINVTHKPAVRQKLISGVVSGVEKPNPGSDGITTSNESAGSPP